MKVLFLFGGLPHYLNKVLNKINSEEDIEVIVIAPLDSSLTFGSGVHQSEEGIEFKLIRLKEYNTWYGKPFFKNFYKTIKKERPDVIVCGWPYFIQYILNPFLLIQIKLKGIALFGREIPFTVPAYRESFSDFEARCVVSQKNELIFKSKIAFLLLKCMRKYLYSFVFKKALLYTEQGIEIINSYGLKKENIIVTYNSPDTEEILATIEIVKLENPDLIRKKNRFLHVGRLVKWKNVDLIIMAIDSLRHQNPDIELAIIGNGEEESNLKSLVADLKLQNHVKFLGAIYEGKEQSIEFLKSDFYILAGMGGLSINEAMTHSLPIICSVADGTEKQLVVAGENGFYFEDSDLNSLIATMEKAMSADKITMGHKSRLIIEEKVNLNIVVEQFVKAFKQ